MQIEPLNKQSLKNVNLSTQKVILSIKNSLRINKIFITCSKFKSLKQYVRYEI